jgi:hypothetical protein
MIRPDHCRTCPLKSTGHVPDANPPNAVAAFVFRHVHREDLIYKEPMTSKGGRYWERTFLHPLGMTRQNVILSSVLRCFPPGGETPTGPTYDAACRHCRHYDGAIEAFQPTVWGITLNPAALIKTPNQETFIQREMERVAQFVQEGERPVLLCGEEARRKYAPWIEGSQKRYRGYWWWDEGRKVA